MEVRACETKTTAATRPLKGPRNMLWHALMRAHVWVAAV